MPTVKNFAKNRQHRLVPSIWGSLVWLFLSAILILTIVGTTTIWEQPLLLAEEKAHPTVAGVTSNLDLSSTSETTDGRAEIVAKFLERYNSPLTPYDHFGRVFVEIADRYAFDFRLLPAIAMQESNLCKVTPPETYNCLGFGIHKRGTLAFPNYEANFERAGKELKANYIDRGLTTPEQIMTKYTPSSNGSWADSVNQWMAEMRYDDRQAGRTKKTDASVLEFVKTE
jgi:hypothetical protein